VILLIGAAFAQDAWLCVAYTPGPRVVGAVTQVHVNGQEAASLEYGEGLCLRAEEGNYEVFFRASVTTASYTTTGATFDTQVYELHFRQELREGEADYLETGLFRTDHLDEREGIWRHEGYLFVNERDSTWWKAAEVKPPDAERVSRTEFKLPPLPPKPDPGKAEREAIDPDQFSLDED